MTDSGYFGVQGVSDAAGSFNAHNFQIDQMLQQTRTGIPVRVVSISGGGAGGAPTVNVQPLINQVDGIGNQTPHVTVFGIPCLRNQGGGNAIINDPAVGDIGYMTISDRDISALKASGKQSNPGSRRRHSFSDGVYVGAMINPANPGQAVQFTATGLKIFDKNGNVIEMAAGAITITGNLRVSGTITAGYGGADAVKLQSHTHAGGPAPTPGT
jgi:hypothetical protein